MPNANDAPGGQGPLMMPYLGVIHWLDASTRVAQVWVDWQLAAWQPVIDAQTAWYRQWWEQAGWPQLPAFPLRGGEQLA